MVGLLGVYPDGMTYRHFVLAETVYSAAVTVCACMAALALAYDGGRRVSLLAGAALCAALAACFKSTGVALFTRRHKERVSQQQGKKNGIGCRGASNYRSVDGLGNQWNQDSRPRVSVLGQCRRPHRIRGNQSIVFRRVGVTDFAGIEAIERGIAKPCADQDEERPQDYPAVPIKLTLDPFAHKQCLILSP